MPSITATSNISQIFISTRTQAAAAPQAAGSIDAQTYIGAVQKGDQVSAQSALLELGQSALSQLSEIAKHNQLQGQDKIILQIGDQKLEIPVSELNKEGLTLSLQSALAKANPTLNLQAQPLLNGAQSLIQTILDPEQGLYKSLLSEGKALHEKVQTLTHEKGHTQKRLGQIASILKDYQALGGKLESTLATLTTELTSLDQQLASAPSPELLKRKESLQKTQTQMLLLAANFTLAEAADASDLAQSSSFGKLRVSVKGKERRAMLTEASGDLSALKTLLKTQLASLKQQPGFESETAQLAVKLMQVETVEGMLSKDALGFEGKIANAKADAFMRTELIKGMVGEIDQLADSSDLDALMTQAMSQDGAVSKSAQRKLDQTRNAMVKAIEGRIKDYKDLGPSKDAVKALTLITSKLKGYDFSHIKGISSFKDQVTDINKFLSETLATIDKSGMTTAGEIKQIKELDGAVNTYFDDVNLADKKQDALAYDVLVRGSKNIETSWKEAWPVAEFLLENPQAEFKDLFKIQNDVVKSIESARNGFGFWLERSIKQAGGSENYEDRPEMQVMALLAKKAKTANAGQPVSYKEIDQDIASLMKQLPPGSAEAKILTKMISQVEVFTRTMAFNQRVVGTASTETDARKQAQGLAQKDTNQCFGVVDDGWSQGKHQGYRIVSYPAGSLATKSEQAGKTAQSLIYVVGQSGGKVQEGGRSKDPTGVFAAGALDNKVIGNAAEEAKVIEAVGARAKTIALKQYDDALGLYQNFAQDDSQLAGFVLKQAVQMLKGKPRLDETDRADLRKMLVQMFGLPAEVGKGSSWTMQHNICNMLEKIQNLRKGEEDKMYELIGTFMESPDFAALKSSVNERIQDIQSARKEISDQSNAEAAFKVTAQFPSVRNEIYREFGFQLDPAKGVPPISDGDIVDAKLAKGEFSSTGEAVFVKQAESWGDWETAKSVGKTAGIIAATVVISLAPGGLAAAGMITASTALTAGMAIGVTTSAVVSGIQIYDADKDTHIARGNFSAGLAGYDAVLQADKNLSLAYVSAAIDLGTTVASFGIAKALGTQSAIKAIVTDMAVNGASMAFNPATYEGDWRMVLANVALGGVVSSVAGAAGKYAEGRLKAKVDIHVDPMNPSQAMIHPKDGSPPVEAIAIGRNGDEVTYQIKGSKEQLTIKIDSANVTLRPPEELAKLQAAKAPVADAPTAPAAKAAAPVSTAEPQAALPKSAVPPSADPAPILAQFGAHKPEAVAKLEPGLYADIDKQLKLMSQGGDIFESLPTLETLMGSGGQWGGKAEDAIVFQTYGVAKNTTGNAMVESNVSNIVLEANVKGVGGDHYGGMSYELSDGTITPRVSDDKLKGIIKEKNADIRDINFQKPPTEAEIPLVTKKHTEMSNQIAQKQATGELGDALPLTRDGTGKNEVSQLARDLAGKKGIDNIAPIMMEEAAMLRDAKVIYFGLTGNEGKFPNSVTTAELLMILNDPELLKKTVFFKIDMPQNPTNEKLWDYATQLMKLIGSKN